MLGEGETCTGTQSPFHRFALTFAALCPCQARRPIVCEHDRDALEVALAMSPSGPDGPRMVFIHSTLVNVVWADVGVRSTSLRM
jgi:hypothetical protein